MKRSRYSETQIVSILKEAEAVIPVEELCRKHGFSQSAFYKWKAKYSWMCQHPKISTIYKWNNQVFRTAYW